MFTTTRTTTFAFLFAAAIVPFASSSAQAQITFTNNNLITIPTVIAPADPFPSSITVSGYTGTITSVSVTLTGFTHSYTDDLAAIVTGPAGQATLLFSGPGLDAPPGTNVTNLTLVFDDSAAATLPQNANFTSGTFLPGLNQYGDVLDAPAPPAPYDTNFNNFLGQTPDGTYSLFIQDYVDELGGSVQSWSITLSGIQPVPEPATTVLASAALLGGLGMVRRWRKARSATPAQG